jgi:peptidoglycan biosynthesis protein MviN/MurJ (putative lipid II flippase)
MRATDIVGLATRLSSLFGLVYDVMIASLFAASMAAIELTRRSEYRLGLCD